MGVSALWGCSYTWSCINSQVSDNLRMCIIILSQQLKFKHRYILKNKNISDDKMKFKKKKINKKRTVLKRQ